MGLCSFLPAGVRALGPPARRWEGDLRPRRQPWVSALSHRGCSPPRCPDRCAAHRLHQKDLSLAKWRRLRRSRGPCVLRPVRVLVYLIWGQGFTRNTVQGDAVQECVMAS